MGLSVGTRLGPYEILAPLGAGGMGEVYRARDTRLGRDVAVKVLPQHLSSNPELKTRFEREARTISSLNHPHICTLHDVGHQDGIDYLVMELLEGETLADRLQKGALPLAQALEYGIQIAEALEKAHKKGIVHRDLKPGNIVLTKSGAKLLDFGLAKPAQSMAAMASDSMETMAWPLTGDGRILGTFQYMAPEQVQGHEADAGTDIFAFGAVLYEMVTGKRAFAGKSQISVMSAILEKEPDPVSAVQPLTPPALDHVIQRALAKDPEERWQSAADVKAELKWIAGAPGQAERSATRHARAWIIAAAAAAWLITVLAAILFFSKPSAPSGLEVRAYIPAPEKTEFVLTDDDAAGPVVISPDGVNIAFTASDDQGRRQLWVRALNGGEARPLGGTDGATYPFWSPDGKWLGFFADEKLKKVPVEAGPVLELADAPRARGGSWSVNNIILFTPEPISPIMAIPAAGGTPKPVTRINEEMHSTHRWPVWLADGKRFLYLASIHGNPVATEHNGIYLASLDGKQNRMLVPADSNAAVASGYLLYVQGGALLAQPFDERRGELTGDPAPVAQDVVHNASTWRSAFDVSRNGLLVYQPGGIAKPSELLWLSPGNKPPTKAAENSDNYRALSLSPDGRKLAVLIGGPGSDVWIYDLARGVKSRFTFTKVFVTNAVWSPDGARIAFSEQGAGGPKIYVKDAGGSGQQSELPIGKTNLNTVEDWSRDGQYLLYRAAKRSPISLYVFSMKEAGTPRLFITGQQAMITRGQFSPDGKWVAYIAIESGGGGLYVTHFPDAEGKWQISSGAAIRALHWLPDGHALLYEKADGTIMKVPFVTHGKDVEIGTPQVYIHARPRSAAYGVTWDVAADGRLIVNTLITEPTHTVNVVMNWTAGLKK